VIYPLAYLALTSALTVVLLAVGLVGQAALAAELAVIQGALLATFYAFSANTRSLILQGHGNLTPDRLLAKRLVALPLLGVASYVLCVIAAGVSPLLALLLIARRSCEWLAEVRLCEIEVAADRPGARRALIVQTTATLLAAAALVLAPGLQVPALAIFAAAPLLGSWPRLRVAAFSAEALRVTLRGITPHIGSTAVDGVSLYVLRLVVFVIVGPVTSGLLFTAFLLGSFPASLFANVLGPSLALHDARGSGRRFRSLRGAGAALMGVLGLAICVLTLAAGLAEWLGKPGYFWLGLGLSLCGGAVMIGAQVIRLRMFDEHRGELLFGPDVLRNLTVIILGPLLFRLGGANLLGALYLATAVVTLFFYWGAKRQADGRSPFEYRAAAITLAAALLLPLFFVLQGGIYYSRGDALLDSGGSIANVPIPLSLGVCFAGLLLLARYRDAMLSLGVVFFLFVAMVLTSVIATQGGIANEARKMLLLFQFLLPAFALALGQMFGARADALRLAATGFLVVLVVLLPAQLLHSLEANGLGDDLWLFSVYQHRQYVPAVVIAAYLVCLFTLTGQRLRTLMVMLAGLASCYAAASYSFLALLLALGGIAVYALRTRERAARLALVLAIASAGAYLVWQRDEPDLRYKYALDAPGAASMPAVNDRLGFWAKYAREIGQSWKGFLFGQPRPPARTDAVSAHNYYLDFVYNFGIVAFLPFLWLIAYTLALLWRERAVVWQEPALLGLTVVVLFALVLDSNIKVPLRQPYPGIFFFFLWGLLITQLQSRRR